MEFVPPNSEFKTWHEASQFCLHHAAGLRESQDTFLGEPSVPQHIGSVPLLWMETSGFSSQLPPSKGLKLAVTQDMDDSFPWFCLEVPYSAMSKHSKRIV